MADTPLQQPPSPQTQTVISIDSDQLQYWCYQCNKRVAVETLDDNTEIICHECNNGFVEVISDHADDPSMENQFIQLLRFMAQASLEDDVLPPPPSEHADNDYLRIELDGRDDDDDEEAAELVTTNEEEDELDLENRFNDGSEENGNSEHRARPDVLRLQISFRDLLAHASRMRGRNLDWADILMGLEDYSIEFRLQDSEGAGYVGNPGDYVDAAGYEELLQILAESDGGGRKGSPPAAESAVLALKAVEIKSEVDALLCVICKGYVNVGEIFIKLPCGHGYHGHCIVRWLGSRNTCPVCRFELPTDDPDYDGERKKKLIANSGGVSSSSGNYFPGL